MDGSPHPPKNSRYQAVPASEDEPAFPNIANNRAAIAITPTNIGALAATPIRLHASIADDDDDDDDDDGNETNSLVDDSNNGSRNNRVFRRSPSQHEQHQASTSISNASSPNRAAAISLTSSMDDALAGSDWDDDDDDDDDALQLRRYHLEVPRNVPLPAEFVGHTLGGRCKFHAHQWWTVTQHNWNALRQSARQRRAARLLTMPSESMRYQCHAGLVSHCCDATDAGIVLTALWVVLWILLGRILARGPSYWMTGLLLFVVRVSARRTYEHFLGNHRRRLASEEAERWKTSRSDHNGRTFSFNSNTTTSRTLAPPPPPLPTDAVVV